MNPKEQLVWTFKAKGKGDLSFFCIEVGVCDFVSLGDSGSGVGAWGLGLSVKETGSLLIQPQNYPKYANAHPA